LNKEDAMDRCKWRKMIKEARWSGWVWVGECFFWYRPTRVVQDQRPLNGRCCCCCCFPGLPRWASTRKVKPNWILLKQDTVSGSAISWGIRKSAPRSRQTTMPAPHHLVFYRPDALPVAQPTASKHWRYCSCQNTQEKQKQHCGVSIELLSLCNSVIKV